jgi:hypothetical protein
MAKYFNRPINYYDLKYMNLKNFNHKSHVDRSFHRLCNYGLMFKYDDKTWKITPFGIEYVKTSAKESSKND